MTRSDLFLRTRLFVTADLAAGSTVPLSADQAHYLRNVLRLGPGAAIALFNGRDGEWLATADAIARNHAALTVIEPRRPQSAGTDLWLCFAPVKKAAVAAIAEKEVGRAMGGERVVKVVLISVCAVTIKKKKT